MATKEVQVYNLDQVLNGQADRPTKNLRLDELHNIYDKMKQDGISFEEAARNLGSVTSRELVREILTRAGVVQGKTFDDLVAWWGEALDKKVKNSDHWLNRHFGYHESPTPGLPTVNPSITLDAEIDETTREVTLRAFIPVRSWPNEESTTPVITYDCGDGTVAEVSKNANDDYPEFVHVYEPGKYVATTSVETKHYGTISATCEIEIATVPEKTDK